MRSNYDTGAGDKNMFASDLLVRYGRDLLLPLSSGTTPKKKRAKEISQWLDVDSQFLRTTLLLAALAAAPYFAVLPLDRSRKQGPDNFCWSTGEFKCMRRMMSYLGNRLDR